jgi:REP element-mobilizing transposase RayT
MARPLRIELAGGLYHVTSRGDRREDIYLNDADRHFWLTLFGAVCRRFNWRCHAWCQMTNHYHVVVETPEANLAQGMRQLNGVYTQYVNRQHRRVGHVFQGRYKAILVERDAYLLELARYVVLNPVRAGMVATPGDWQWSSWPAMVGSEAIPDWLEIGWVLGQFSGSPAQVRQGYIAFVREGVGLPSLWRELSGQIYLGSEPFIRDAQATVAGALDHSEIPRIQRRPLAKPLETYRENSLGRDAGILAAFATGDYTQLQIAQCFGVHYSTVSRIVKRGFG